MKPGIHTSLSQEGFLLLLKESLGSIPFNVALAALLSLDLLYNRVPVRLVGSWFFIVFLISFGRWAYSSWAIKTEYYRSHLNPSLPLFLALTFCMGLTWGMAFFIFLSTINLTQEAIIVLVLGGMSAGAIASLSVYLPAYYAYVIPMFVPIIFYNIYSFTTDKVIVGIMYALFVAMLFVTAKINSKLLHTTFRLGKEKDLLIHELTASNHKLTESISEVRTMSITDFLTGLHNRRYFDKVLHQELRKAKDEDHSVNLVLIDIDNFKFVNDTFGHPAGDAFLIYVASALKDSIRDYNDTIFRLGGDEFAVILAQLDHDAVLHFCDVLQHRFQSNNLYKNVTLSMGIISIGAFNSLDAQYIFTAADKTLYQAKQGGKNKIIAKFL